MKGNQKKIAVKHALAERAAKKMLTHDGKKRQPKAPRKVSRIPGVNGRWIKIES